MYTLEKKPASDLNKFIVTIKADSNDADYIATISKYSKKDFEEYVIQGLIDLREKGTGRHKLEDYDNEYDLDIPFNGWDGQCHTLESVKVEYVDENGITWVVKY